MASKKIAIIGGSVWGNRGAAAMLETTIGKLRETLSDVQFSIFTPYPLKDHSLVNDTQLKFFDSRPVALVQYLITALWGRLIVHFGGRTNFSGGVSVLTSSDVLLDIGGITFADGRLIFLPYNILTIWPSIMYGVPVVKLSQAAGTFKNPLIRVLSRYFLSRCDHFFARGEKTLDFLEELGLDLKKLAVAADIAFIYESEYCLSSENKIAVAQLCAHIDEQVAKGHKIIAISPSALVWEKMKTGQINYNQLLVRLMKQIKGQDITFVIFPNASREGSKKTRNNDIHVIELLRDEAELQLPYQLYKRVNWVCFDVDTHGIEKIIRRADILLASRFHAMVFGLRLGVPTVVIGWGHKYKEVMKKFGQEKYVFDYEMDDNNLAGSMQEILIKKDSIVSEIKSALDNERASSSNQFDYLVRNIL